MPYVYGKYDKKRIKVRILQKGKDGSTWYSGDVSSISLCKTGDFCLNPDTFDILKCTSGGSPDTAQWETVCNLDATGEIKQILAELEANPITSAWFGTRDEYNALTQEEREAFELHFIEEGT